MPIKSIATINIKDDKMKQYNEIYDLDSNEYLSDIIDNFDLSSGVVLIHGDVGIGKSVVASEYPNSLFAAPLVSIVESFEGSNAKTWNSIISTVRNNPERETAYKKTTLWLDECHGMYSDYDYKGLVIEDMIKIFKYFKCVVLMSGTIELDYITSVNIDRAYRVRKPSEATKFITPYVYEKEGKAFLEQRILANKGTGKKAIALVNDIELCKRIAKQYGDKALFVCADNKHDETVKNFYRTGVMTDYELVIGTDSIREGLSIKDKLQEVDVFVYGHRDPDAIEQFANRFRNVSDVKNVYYIVNKMKDIEAVDFDKDLVLSMSTKFQAVLTEMYKNDIDSLNSNKKLINQYYSEIKGGNCKFDKVTETFNILHTAIDCDYYKHRLEQTKNDWFTFESRVVNLGFIFNQIIDVNGLETQGNEMREEMKVSKREAKEERVEMLESLKEACVSGVHKYENEEYDGLFESINKLRKAGLKESQVNDVIDGYINDSKFIAKCWYELEYIQTNDDIRSLVLNHIATKCPDDTLSRLDLMIIANDVARKVLADLFCGDVSLMASNKEWKNHIIVKKGLQGLSNDTVEVKERSYREIINRYITLDKPKRVHVHQPFVKRYGFGNEGTKEYIHAVKYTNLIGFKIEKSIDAFTTQDVKKAVDLKNKFNKLKFA